MYSMHCAPRDSNHISRITLSVQMPSWCGLAAADGMSGTCGPNSPKTKGGIAVGATPLPSSLGLPNIWCAVESRRQDSRGDCIGVAVQDDAVGAEAPICAAETSERPDADA
mmetsp:Transcript_76514/g.221127  ORF Transcript_76514/g.221127 Transcript_76514/m.221127 type:complete len:111 (-) Transcript_76514:156-488(-)